MILIQVRGIDIKTDSGFGFRVIVAGIERESLSSRSVRVDANHLGQHEEHQENLVATGLRFGSAKKNENE
jgi:hypothetical protein